VPLDEDVFAYAFRSSGELTYRLESDCENTNTQAHGDVHLVMLAYLRRRWSLSDRDGFGALSLSRRVCKAGFGAFVEVKRLFSTTPEADHWGDRTLNRTQSRHDRTRPVSDSSSRARGLGFTTGASGQAPEGKRTRRVDRTRWCVWSQLDAYWNRPDAGTVASDQFKRRVRSAFQLRDSS
jgi:hypothetical protein